jgi:radical SAM superfamily enzyme YgiQ (UPF0313 family)
MTLIDWDQSFLRGQQSQIPWFCRGILSNRLVGVNKMNSYKKVKKLLLINPVGRKSGFLLSKISTFPPLGLAYVAAATPAGWEVAIIDENIDQFEFIEADLIGITAFTSNINRAYEIAGIYRERNIKIVMGGIHASMNPDEALQYCDTVVIGEAEGIWGKVIHDFEHGKLSQIYNGPQINLSEFVLKPRRDLFHQDYFWHPVQTSRGCPFDCNFCSVSKHLGKQYRQRGPEDVLDELAEIKSQYIVFVDDNLIGHSIDNKNSAAELFLGMIQRKLNKKWWMQTSINAVDDERVIELAAKAGCMFVFIGFETINDGMLNGMAKGINLKVGVKNYKNVVDTFHKYGIAVLGAFIIGNDNESLNYYKVLSDFLIASGIDMIQISILTPLPGTRLMEQLSKDGRILFGNFPTDWDKYRFSYVVHSLHGIESEEVYAGNNYIKKSIYSFPTYQYRLVRSFFKLKNIYLIITIIKINQALKRSWEKSHYSNVHL